jgi:hypothetical protein
MSKKTITRICIYITTTKEKSDMKMKERGKNNMMEEKRKSKEQRIKEWNKIFLKAKRKP